MKISSKLSEYKIKKVLWYFCIDVEASKAAMILGINRNTVNRWYGLFRRAIYEHQMDLKEQFIGDIAVDEHYLDNTQICGFHEKTKRGHETGKQPVFGIFERDGHVYTELVPEYAYKKHTLQHVVQGKLSIESVISSGRWRGYNALVDVGCSIYFCIHHTATDHAKNDHPHINGSELFWNYTKRRLAKFNGVKSTFALHLKESEWRWKREPEELSKELWVLLRKKNTSTSRLRAC